MGKPRRVGERALEVRFLGPLEVARGGRMVGVGGPKPRALLAALALEVGRVVSVDRLVDSLWPGEPPKTASHAVQVYVSQLRKILGDVVATRAPGYTLELDAAAIDVHRFEHLVREGRELLGSGDAASAASMLADALGLWRGPALADFTYEPFAQADISRLEELRVVAIEERIEADLALGRHAELSSELEALVDAHPLRERPRRQLMLALYRSGRQADALGAYRAARETLVDELGVEPGPELKALEAAILRQDETLLPPAGPSAPAMQFRRLVTVLFVDVVDSLALAEALDAEALGAVLRRYFETVSAALTRHGGAVEKYVGDAVMAAFGVPVSHEDDALRSARAALDLRAGVAALNGRLLEERGVGLEVRVGLETGEVVATATDARQRLLTGESVGIAARLGQAAHAGEIVVGPLAARLIDHAAKLEPLGDLAIKGKREPVRAFRLLEIERASSAFERRLDARLVGRKAELRRLRALLEAAVETASPQAALVGGPPGIGKSRLAEEIARRAKGVTTISGRCLSYGDGITYWPLREIVERASKSEEREALRADLEADPPPPAAEIAWSFRRFCGSLARSKPLLLVFDDLHWAEPTFLELVEALVEKGEGPMLVLCLAREELLEENGEFLRDAERFELEALQPAELDALVDGLGGGVLESDQRSRIAESAEGNPLFLEQLLALALEGGLGERELPATVQALLAARLDRLGPGERAVLERGAVVGKEFGADDVVSLLDPTAAPTAQAHFSTLTDRGFIRRRGEASFAFRHGLVQQAVYRAAPKRLRAELHERFAERLEGGAYELPDLDEFVGYHLEQASRLRGELRDPEERVAALAHEAGRRLGAAGLRAFRRSDLSAASTLLRRAIALLPDDAVRRELLVNLGIVRVQGSDRDQGLAVLEDAVVAARRAEDRTMESWAGIELEYVRLVRDGGTGDDLLAAATRAIPILERESADRALGRAWIFAGWVRGGHRSDHTAWAEAAERALVHYRKAGWPVAAPVGQLAAALYWGPTPVQDAISRCEQLLASGVDRLGTAFLQSFLGGLRVQQGDVEAGRELTERARLTLEDLGFRVSANTYSATVLGEIGLLTGDGVAAEAQLGPLCEYLAEIHDRGALASRASDLAEALLLQGRLDEAEEWTMTAESNAAADDVNAQMMWRSIRGRVAARRGAHGEAEELAREGARRADETDDLNRRGEAHRDLGEVLVMAGRAADAAAELERARELFGQKGNVVGEARVRSLQDELAVA